MNYVGINTVLERAYKKLPAGEDINREDAVEWVWEAIEKIGAVNGAYFEMYEYIEISDYRGKLPGYISSVISVSYISDDPTIIDNEEELIKKERWIMGTALEPFYQDVPQQQRHKGLRYKILNGYIHTTFEEGVIEIAYKAVPIDENNEPVVDDGVYTLEAMTWYIVKNVLWRCMVRDTTYEKLYNYADKEWNFYCNSAACRKLLPGRDEMTALNNKHLRIVPNDLWRNMSKRNTYLYPTATRDELNSFILDPTPI